MIGIPPPAEELAARYDAQEKQAGKIPATSSRKKAKERDRPVFRERAPTGLRPKPLAYDKFQLYSGDDGKDLVNQEFVLTGLVFWYSQSKFAGDVDYKWTFRLLRPLEMGIPWIEKLEACLQRMIRAQAMSACRKPLVFKSRIRQDYMNDTLCNFLFFSHEGKIPFRSTSHFRSDADKDDLPNLTPVRLSGHLRSEIKARNEEVQLCMVPSCVTVIPMPPYLAPLEKAIRSGPDVASPPDAHEEPDGDAYPLPERDDMDRLFAPGGDDILHAHVLSMD